MSEESKTYAISEIVGTSGESISSAIDNALHTASKTLRNLDWFEMTSVRGSVGDDGVSQYQVTVKVGFRYDD